MEILRIRGGNQLAGQVEVSGSKNAALPQLAAALLSDQETILENVPDLSDIRFMAEIISHLGADISKIGPGSWKIHPLKIQPDPPYELVRKMRASICLLGPLVARIKKAKVPMPGGCVIGHRPIDLHLHALQEMGAEISLNQGIVEVDGSAMKAGNLFIGGRHGSTVTGTANAIMAAVLTAGTTTLDGACEPEIVDLVLCSRNGGIWGRFLPLTIEGVDQLNGCVHRVILTGLKRDHIMGAPSPGKIQYGIGTGHLGAFSKVMQPEAAWKFWERKLDVHTDPNGASSVWNHHPALPWISHWFTSSGMCSVQASQDQHNDRKSTTERFTGTVFWDGAEVSWRDPVRLFMEEDALH